MELKALAAKSSEWENAIKQIPEENKDINYISEWFETWVEHENATPVCLYLEYDDYHILYPFFIRKIINYTLKQDYYDIQSAYGYGGVIANKKEIPAYVVDKFNQLTDEWLIDNNVIAEFIRENPLLNSIKRNADYSLVRQNVYVGTDINYKVPDKQARQNIKKALSSGLKVIYDTDMEFMDEFSALYKLTARRLQMNPYYFFGSTYFNNVKTLLNQYATLIHVMLEDKIVASGLYFLYNKFATLHLVGSDPGYLDLRINDLLYDGTIQYSIKCGARTLNVGGGTSNDPGDTLFRFKSKYSHNFKPVLIGRKVLNRNIYSKLTKAWEDNNPQLTEKYTKYFLKYRIEH